MTAVLAAAGEIATVAGGFFDGSGPASIARLDNPLGLPEGGSGSLYVADLDNDTVRKVESLAIPAAWPPVSSPFATATSTTVSPGSTPTV